MSRSGERRRPSERDKAARELAEAQPDGLGDVETLGEVAGWTPLDKTLLVCILLDRYKPGANLLLVMASILRGAALGLERRADELIKQAGDGP